MKFVCPKCGGDADYWDNNSYHYLEKYSYVEVKEIGFFKKIYAITAKCTKCNHTFKVKLSQRQANKFEKEMTGKVKKE